MKEQHSLRLSSILIDWYNVNKRSLPWRDTSDPYIIWLSEIILQQTRVGQGRSYFDRFVDRFPTVDLLATAHEDEVLKLWQGLGYYSRARNLHAAAKMIMSAYGGLFPTTYSEVLQLKGVGGYTAAAVVSFAYGLPHAVVDGNVYRVLSRIFAIEDPIDSTKGKKIFAQLAQELLDVDNAGLHNQAIMEFGALQCVPTSPDCVNCTASTMCLAYARNEVSAFPVKQGKQKTRNRYFNYLDIRCGDTTYLTKRTAKDIWQNLYEYPLLEFSSPHSIDQLVASPQFQGLFAESDCVKIRLIKEFKHVLSHQIIYASFYRVDIDEDMVCADYDKILYSDLEVYPVSRLMHKYIENI